MQQDREVLLVVYRSLQESAQSIRRIAAAIPGSGKTYDQIIALNDALSEFVAEMDFILARGGFDEEALEYLNRTSLQPILKILSESRLIQERK